MGICSFVKKTHMLICLSAITIAGCISGGYNPGPAEIVFENRSYKEDLNGKNIDFIGLQIYKLPKSYNGAELFNGKNKPDKVSSFFKFNDFPNFSYVSFSVDEEKEYLNIFLRSIDPRIQNKIHAFNGNSFFFKDGKSAYRQIQLLYYNYIPIYDEWNRSIKENNLDGSCLEYLKNNSNADYFFIVSIRPLVVQVPDENNKCSSMKVALLTVIYNKNGEKVYCKIYEDKLDGIKIPQNAYYNSSRKLLENYGQQINSDLNFFLNAKDAEYPTVRDLYKELNEGNRDSMHLRILKK